MNDSILRKIYKEKADRDWDEEGPYLSMSETDFVETAKELIKERDELIKDLIVKIEDQIRELKDIKYTMSAIHNSCDLTIDNIRAEMLVLASRITYQVEAVNHWNIKPTIEKAKKLVGEVWI